MKRTATAAAAAGVVKRAKNLIRRGAIDIGSGATKMQIVDLDQDTMLIGKTQDAIGGCLTLA